MRLPFEQDCNMVIVFLILVYIKMTWLPGPGYLTLCVAAYLFAVYEQCNISCDMIREGCGGGDQMKKNVTVYP